MSLLFLEGWLDSLVELIYLDLFKFWDMQELEFVAVTEDSKRLESLLLANGFMCCKVHGVV